MVKIIVIFTIVFVYYCEINAEIAYSQNKETATADFQKNPFKTDKEHADIKRIQRRVRKGTQTKRHTTGSREDSNGLSEFVQSDSEAHINMLFKPGVVNSRRFNKMDTNLDSESIKPERSRKYHHHSTKKHKENKKYKKHDSANNEGKKIHKKDEKDIEENDSSSGSSSIENLHTQKRRFKIKDRHDKKKSKHPEDTSMSHEREKDKKKQIKDKSKDKKEEKKGIGEAKRGIRILSKTPWSKNDITNKTEQLEDNRRLKQNKPSKNNTSKNVVGFAKLSSAESKTTIKVTKSPQRKKTDKKPTTTKSTKPKPKPTHLTPKTPKKKLRPHSLQREVDEQIRSTKLSALSLHGEKKKGHTRSPKKLRHDGSAPQGKMLSPYSIMAQMDQLMKEFPEANVSVTKLAHTVEYNDIVMVTIKEAPANTRSYFRTQDSKYIDDVPEKKIIFIVHGLTVMGLQNMPNLVEFDELKLLMSYYLKHLDKFDFMLMPLANPDGYSASFSRIWNKNTSPQEVCSGVYLDRNFDVSWNSSHDISSCSQLYPGPNAFSEEESKAVRDVLHQYSHKILAYIHVHAGMFSYLIFKGEAILYPKGYTFTQSDDDRYIDLKGEIDEAMKNASFRVMSVTVDTLANWYGLVHGTSVDYAASVYGIPYALEFVMQIYDTKENDNNALTQIWSRLIDTTFNNMWKSLQRGADARRTYF